MTDRDAGRREVAAEMAAFADRNAWAHWQAMQDAERYDKAELAERCGMLVSAWRQVEAELRDEYGLPPRGEVL